MGGRGVLSRCGSSHPFAAPPSVRTHLSPALRTFFFNILSRVYVRIFAMDSRLTCGPWLLVVLLMGCGRLWGFNLDTDNVLRKTGTEGSLFGFSLAMHRQLKPVDKRM